LQNLIHCQSHQKVRDAMRQRLLRRMKEIGEAEPTITQAESRPSNQRIVRDDEVMR